jgi:hypothetical protein
MRLPTLGAAIAALWITQAQAQLNQPEPTIAVPPAPAIMATPTPTPLPAPPTASPPAAEPQPAASQPPGLVQTPLPPPAATTDSGTNTDTGAAPAAPAPQAATTPPAPANVWVPGTTAKLRVLDKVGGGVSDLTIPVGGQATAGNLQISVLACALRPPGQIPDSAIFLSIAPAGDSTAAPSYRGWMVRSVPAASVVGNANETFRVVNCS